METAAEKVKSWGQPVMLALIIALMSGIGVLTMQSLNRIESSVGSQEIRLRDTEIGVALNTNNFSNHQRQIHGQRGGD